MVGEGGRRTAIEVELQRKSKRRLGSILSGYRGLIRAGLLNDVSYVTDRRDVAELVREQADAASMADRVHVGPLDELIETARRRATMRRERAS
jgi:hypothetical protein